jgi:hypothetical protein
MVLASKYAVFMVEAAESEGIDTPGAHIAGE